MESRNESEFGSILRTKADSCDNLRKPWLKLQRLGSGQKNIFLTDAQPEAVRDLSRARYQVQKQPHPREVGVSEVQAYFSYLAVARDVAVAT